MVEIHDMFLGIISVDLLVRIDCLSDFQTADVNATNRVSFDPPVVHLDLFADVIAKPFPLPSCIGFIEVL